MFTCTLYFNHIARTCTNYIHIYDGCTVLFITKIQHRPVFHNPGGNPAHRRTISRFMPFSSPSAERSYMWKIWASCQWVWLQ